METVFEVIKISFGVFGLLCAGLCVCGMVLRNRLKNKLKLTYLKIAFYKYRKTLIENEKYEEIVPVNELIWLLEDGIVPQSLINEYEIKEGNLTITEGNITKEIKIPKVIKRNSD